MDIALSIIREPYLFHLKSCSTNSHQISFILEQMFLVFSYLIGFSLESMNTMTVHLPKFKAII